MLLAEKHFYRKGVLGARQMCNLKGMLMSDVLIPELTVHINESIDLLSREASTALSQVRTACGPPPSLLSRTVSPSRKAECGTYPPSCLMMFQP